MGDTARRRSWLGRFAVVAGLLVASLGAGLFLVSRADGPVFVFAGAVKHTLEQFRTGPTDDPKGGRADFKKARQKFDEAKVPDFASRLAGLNPR